MPGTLELWQPLTEAPVPEPYTTHSDPFPRTVGVGQSQVCAGISDRLSSDHQGLLSLGGGLGSWSVSPTTLPAS